MEAFGVTDYRLIDLYHFNDPDLVENILDKSLDIINRGKVVFIFFNFAYLFFINVY